MTKLGYADERYQNDTHFRQLVKTLEMMIHDLNFSPSEIREAAMYASLRVELCRKPKPVILSPELVEHLKMEEILGRRT